MPGPQKQFDREQALNQALELFWAQGYEATSMQDLVQAMGVNRASLYDTFGNKQAIYRHALERYFSTMQADLEQLREAPGAALDSLKGFLQALGKHILGPEHHGCFINNTAVELGPHEPEIAAKIRQFWGQIEGAIQAVLDKAVVNGEIRPQAETADLARFINTTLQGLAVKSKTGVSVAERDATLAILLHSLEL